MFKILFIQPKRVCRNAQTRSLGNPKNESWSRSLTRASTLVNLTALVRHETTVSRILADDGEPGGAKFRSPRRDAHKKDRRDTVILAPGMVRESERGTTSGNWAHRVWLHSEYLFHCGSLKRERRGKTPRKLQSQRARDLSFSPLFFEEWLLKVISLTRLC